MIARIAGLRFACGNFKNWIAVVLVGFLWGVSPFSLLGAQEGAAGWKLNGDFKMHYRYSNWTPASIQGAEYDVTGLNIAVAELDLSHEMATRLFFPKLPKLRYEWAPGGDTALQQELIELQSEMDHSYVRHLADISLIRLGFIEDILEEESLSSLDVQYEAFAFASDLKLKEGKTYVPFSGEMRSLSAGDVITSRTVFKKYTLAVDLLPDLPDEDVQHSVELGVFHLRFEKPYAVTISGVQQSDTIRDSEFSATGLGFKYSSRWKFSGDRDEASGLYGRGGLGLDFGIGDIRFANEQQIADFLPFQTDVHYYGISVDAGLSWVVGSFSFDVGAAYRYHTFELAQKTPNGSFSTARLGELDINTDSVFSLTAGISIVF